MIVPLRLFCNYPKELVQTSIPSPTETLGGARRDLSVSVAWFFCRFCVLTKLQAIKRLDKWLPSLKTSANPRFRRRFCWPITWSDTCEKHWRRSCSRIKNWKDRQHRNPAAPAEPSDSVQAKKQLRQTAD